MRHVCEDHVGRNQSRRGEFKFLSQEIVNGHV